MSVPQEPGVVVSTTGPTPDGPSGFWPDLRAAMNGAPQDYTSGPIGRAVLLLAIPMVLEMMMESLLGVCDVFFVARLGANAIATVGITEALLTLIFGVAIGLSMAATAMVARRIGEKSPRQAAEAAVQAIWLGVLLSVPIGIAGGLWASTLLRWMGASPEVVALGAPYTAITLGGNLTILMLFLINAAFRGAGDAMIAMRAVWLANLVNIVLDPCLIFGLGPFPEMGLTGGAVGSVVGRGSGVAYQVYALWRSRGHLQIRLARWRLDPLVMGQLLRVSMGGIFQFLVATASWLMLVRIVSYFGSSAVAGYTVALRLIVFAILPAWGLSNAAATLVGQNLGAGQPRRAERSVWMIGVANMLFLGGVTVVFLVLAERLVRLFVDDPVVVSFGVDCLRYVSYGYVFYAYGMVLQQAFNGAGDTTTPTIINLICYWLFQIPLAYVLAVMVGLGAQGVFLTITISESALAVVCILVFRRGRWKSQVI